MNQNNKAVPSSERDSSDGTVGFNPQLAGHGKVDKSNTSSFDGPADYMRPGYFIPAEAAPGQEEGGRQRQPTTSIAGRVHEKSETR
jgi:hypothetical protein